MVKTDCQKEAGKLKQDTGAGCAVHVNKGLISTTQGPRTSDKGQITQHFKWAGPKENILYNDMQMADT